MKNLPAPRLGELDDETLIKGFLDQGMTVIEADYQGDPRAAAPELLPEIDRWYGYLFRTEEHPVDNNWIYIVPEGYAIDRKVQICEVRGMPVAMDMIYPSGQSDPVPLMLQITSTKDPGKWINQRAYYIYGLLTTGYAGAITDYNGGDRLSPVGRVFPEKQVARLLRANAKKWNLSGKLGVTGYSKGSSRAAKAAFVNEAEFEDDPGPHAEQSARFQVVLASAGQHTKEFLIEDGYLDEVSQAKRETALSQQKEEPVEDLPFQKGLPDPFLMPDAKRVQTLQDWRKQREYIKAMLAHYLYGQIPPLPRQIEVEQISSEPVYDGEGVEERYTLTIRRKGRSVTCRFLIVRPSLKKRYPTIIKNDRVSFDASPERSDLSQSFDPGSEAVKRGYLLCRFHRTDLASDDREAGREAGVYPLYPEYDWGALAVWGWGHGVVLDALNQLGVADMSKVVATGHSRGGKAALLDFADHLFFDKKTDRRFDNWNYPGADLPFDWKAPDVVPAK